MWNIRNDWFIVQQGLKLSSWFSFDVIALFTFPSSMIQGWWVSGQRKNGGSKSYIRVLKGLIMHISLSTAVNVSLAHDYQLPMSGRLILPQHMRLNTSIFIFWIQKVCALISSWKVFSSNFGKQTFLIGNRNTNVLAWCHCTCFGVELQSAYEWVNEIATILRNQNRMRILGNRC